MLLKQVASRDRRIKMEFDINRVFTTVNADEVEPGSIGYFADFYNELKQKVREGTDIRELKFVYSADYISRFKSKRAIYGLFYLIKGPGDITEGKFDKSKVMTPVNAEDAEVGSKGYFSDDLHRLKLFITRGCGEICTLTRVEEPSYSCRFVDQYGAPYVLFYPIEED